MGQLLVSCFIGGNELGRNLLREGGWLQAAQGYSCHLLLRDNQQEQLHMQMKHPLVGTLLVHFDMEEPSCLRWNLPIPVRKTLCAICAKGHNS